MDGLAKNNNYTVEFLESLPDGERAELFDGEIYYMATPSVTHQYIVSQMTRIIGNHIEAAGLPCRVYPAPFGVYLMGMDDTSNYFEPDISIVCDSEKTSNDKGCNGAPDWVIEITSPSTRSRDYLLKLEKYRIAGVREYWIINPDSKTVSVFDFEKGSGSNVYNFTDSVPVQIYPDFSVQLSSLL